MSTERQGGNLLATAAGVLLKNSKFDMLHHRGSSTTGSLVDYTHRKQFRTGHPYYVFFFLLLVLSMVEGEFIRRGDKLERDRRHEMRSGR